MRTKLMMLTVGSILALSACGTAAGGSSSSGGGSTTATVKVGVIPVSDLATVFIAQDQGFFKKQGLTVETQLMQNASAIVPAVMNGQLQVGTTANVPYLTAKAKNLPIQVIANGADTSGDAATDYSGLFVAKNSTITRPRDLEGKTVATNNLQNVLQLAVAKSVQDDGGDPSKVRFVAMPFPNMVAALGSGGVDAISVVEPYFSEAEASGAKLLNNPYTEAFPANTMLAMYFASDQWLKANPAEAKKFASAIDEAGTYAASHPDAVRKAIVEHLKMDPSLADKIRLPKYGEPMSASSLETTADLMVKFGFIPQAPSEKDLVWQP